MSKSKDKDMSDFPSKWKKKLPSEFSSIVDGLSSKELEQKLLECQAHIYNLDKEEDSDAKLNGAKDLVKELKQPYAEARTVENAKIKYLFFLLEAKGHALV